MKPSTENLTGIIERYDERRGGFTVFVPYTDWLTLAKRGYSKCLIQLKDERPLSHKQRNACYALINAISNWTGMDKSDTKDYFKLKYLADDINETGEKIFSLADAPMSLICGFQRFLVDFIVREGIPCDFDLLSYVDDIPSYVYSCLVNKKCLLCGKKADLHHWERVGMGRDRTDIIHEGMMVMPLCREHHAICHNMPQREFDELYHLVPVECDKTICHIYGLKSRKG